LPDHTDRYALYEHAHHDLWWAKAQQWNVGNWTLLLIAALVTVARTLPHPEPLTASYSWPFIVTAAIVAVAGTWYLARLHGDVVHNRRVYRELETQTGIKALRDELRSKGLERANESSDRTRGIEVLYLMVIVFAAAVGFATCLLGATPCVGLLTTLGVASVNVIILARAA